jgi:hypothetical protein
MALSLLMGILLPVAAFADIREDNLIDTEQIASMTVVSKAGDVVLSGAHFRLYHVATVSEEGEYKMKTAFEESGISLGIESADESWSDRAVTLEGYVVGKNADNAAIDHTQSGRTDSDGNVLFSGLSTGLYLLVGDPVTVGNKIYTPLATLISLPYGDNGVAGSTFSGRYTTQNYNPTINIKYSVTELGEPDPTPPPTDPPFTPEEVYTNLTAIKIWKDEGYETSRPTEISVTLYRNGEEYDTVVLNAQNSWKHTWSVLDDDSRWQLVEKNVPTNYTVTSVQDGKAFVVTNTYKEEQTVTPPPTVTPAQPSPAPSATPTPSQPKLPQTGQLWWPISLLALCGLVLILIGVKLRNKGSGN